MPQQRQSWHQTQKDPKLQYYFWLDSSLQVALPWGISCHLRASSLPSSYCGSYWELGMRHWSLEAGWFAVDGPCTPAPGSQLRKRSEGIPRHGYPTAICSFSKDRGGRPLGGLDYTRWKPSWKGRSQAKL